MRWIFALAALAVTWNVEARDIREEANQELDLIKRVFATGYAPREWKKQQYGWDLEAELKKAQSTVAQKQDLTIQEYRRIAHEFLRSTRDYHVNVAFHTTERASLPFSVAGAEGRYFIVWIDREKLSRAQFPLDVGDEILEFGGQPIADVIAEIKTRVAWSVDETDEGIAQMVLTRRSAASGFEVPSGPIEIKAQRRGPGPGPGLILTHQLMWEYTPEDATIHSGNNLILQSKTPAKIQVDRQMVWPGWRELQATEEKSRTAGGAKHAGLQAAANPWRIGAKKSWVPDLGTKIWEAPAEALFHAYIYRTPNRNLIGYVRIPYYGGGTAAFNEFKALIKKFESTTDALVIDQVNNPGGSIFYLSALQTVLNPQVAFNPPHRVALYPEMIVEVSSSLKQLAGAKTDADVQKLVGGEDIQGYPVNYEFGQFLINFNRFIMNEWKAGKTLTAPTHLWGLDKINPNRDVTYSKPILVLVNNLCFSGGDFFPSILQDNQRAKIFGTRTAGAGGYVLDVSVPSSLGLDTFTFTGSIAVRLGQQPIENLGVTPDISYDLTPADFMSNYAPYRAAVQKAVDGLLQSTPTSTFKP